jgi:glycerophosphoryl diester phosphodiesterase
MERKIIRFLAGLVALLILAYVVLAILASPVDDSPFFEEQVRPMVIAHRGGKGLRPGNTMAAFSFAVELDVDVLEMDIHRTADGVIVVMHDDTVDRTTDGSGRLQDLTLAELKALDAGYYWTEDDGQTYPYRGQGITVPTLEELFIAFPDMRMNIEIKQESPSIVEPFCRLIREFNMADKVLIGTFHETTLDEFRETCPGIATSMVESEIRLLYVLSRAYLDALFQAPAEATQIPEFSGDLQVATERFVQAAHGHNVSVHVWTVNETEDMERLLEMGVDGIITDRPDRLLELLAKR